MSAVLLLMVMLFITGIKTFHVHPAAVSASVVDDAFGKQQDTTSIQQDHHCPICEFQFSKHADTPAAFQWQSVIIVCEVPAIIPAAASYYNLFPKGIFLRGPPSIG